MKKQAFTAAAVALSMAFGSLAVAQDRDRHDGPQDRHDDRRGPPPQQRDRDRHDDHRDDRRGMSRGAGPEHSYYRGGRLPPQYRTRQYVVNDWRGRHLSAPPRGYQWVQTGTDFVLVAIATGIIAQVLLNQ